MARSLLLAAVLLLAAADAATVSPVQKVVQLIDEMAGKVTKEMEEGMKVFEEYAKYCDDEATAKGYAIKDSNEAIEEFSATILDSKAIIESETAKVSALTTKISDTEGEVSTAVALREKERDAFLKVEAEMVTTTEELAGAQ